jgi:prepilin-type N-terminal cleavage/methylation domain-containing protein
LVTIVTFILISRRTLITAMHSSSSRRAFTLIELLVVIGVIAVLVGTVGVAMRGGNRNVALQSAQSSLASLAASARAQAAVGSADATVVVWGDENDHTTYLRRAAVMVNISGNNWVIKGDVIDLPNGVFFVPPDLGTNPSAKYLNAADWPDPTPSGGYLRTEASGDAPQAMTIQRWNATTGAYEDDPSFPAGFEAYKTIKLDALGRRTNGNRALVIAAGEPTPGSGVLFRDSDSQRGLYLSEYGIPTLINEKAGLEK